MKERNGGWGECKQSSPELSSMEVLRTEPGTSVPWALKFVHNLYAISPVSFPIVLFISVYVASIPKKKSLG